MTLPDHPYYASAPTARPRATAQVRPATLVAGWIVGLLAGVCGIVGAVLLISGARQTAQDAADAVLSILGQDATQAAATQLVQATVDDAAHTLQVRGAIGLVAAVLTVLLALAAHNGARAPRIIFTVVALALVGAEVIVLRDVAPSTVKTLDVAAMLLAVVAVVALFLPPTTRYARDRRQARA